MTDVEAGSIATQPHFAEDPPIKAGLKQEHSIFGVSLSHWIPPGGWKDILVGDYDYTYLFVVQISDDFCAVNHMHSSYATAMMTRMEHCMRGCQGWHAFYCMHTSLHF